MSLFICSDLYDIMAGFKSLLILSLLVHSMMTISGNKNIVMSDFKIMNYLKRYGYMDENVMLKDNSTSDSNEKTKKLMNSGLMMFQSFMKLNVTGEMNSEIEEIMLRPRCGMKDIENEEPKFRRKRNAKTKGNTWEFTNLTFSVNSYPVHMNTSEKLKVENILILAFNTWSQVSSLNFSMAERAEADIKIDFATGKHGNYDGDEFRDDMRELAHAFYPQYGGDIHFNNNETWSLELKPSGNSTNLLRVAIHEIGHSLGLMHSNITGSIMQPTYQSWFNADKPLNDEDVFNVQSLYNGNYTSEAPPDICLDPAVDTAFYFKGSLHVTKGLYLWKIITTTDNTIEKGYPILTSQLLKLRDPNYLDAVLVLSDEKVLVFKGDQYWQGKAENSVIYFSHSCPIFNISKGIIPSNLSAAFIGERAVFIKGDSLWNYKFTGSFIAKKLDATLTSLGLKPGGIDAAAFLDEHSTYFFQGHHYYNVDPKSWKVLSDNQSTADLFGCQSHGSLIGNQKNVSERSGHVKIINSSELLTLFALIFTRSIFGFYAFLFD